MEAPPGFEPGMEDLQKTDSRFPAGRSQAFLQQIRPFPVGGRVISRAVVFVLLRPDGYSLVTVRGLDDGPEPPIVQARRHLETPGPSFAGRATNPRYRLSIRRPLVPTDRIIGRTSPERHRRHRESTPTHNPQRRVDSPQPSRPAHPLVERPTTCRHYRAVLYFGCTLKFTRDVRQFQSTTQVEPGSVGRLLCKTCTNALGWHHRLPWLQRSTRLN